MPIEITIPRLGWSMDEGTFGEWLKKDGEFVAAGEPVFLMESDKALQEIESVDEGILHIVPEGPREGDTVKVGMIVGYLLAEGEEPPVVAPARVTVVEAAAAVEQTTQSSEPVSSIAAVAAAPSVRRLARQLGVDLQTFDRDGGVSSHDVRRAAASLTPVPADRFSRQGNVPRRNAHPALPKISPRAARTAESHGIDWSTLRGTGRHGRIRERDVIAAARRRMPVNLPDVPGKLARNSKIRQTIAQRMLAGVQETAPVTLTTKVDASELVGLREELPSAGEHGAPTYTDLLVKLVANTLGSCPELNACWTDEGVYLYYEINIAIAVETPAGLLAPVLKNVAALSLDEIAVQSRRLVEQARGGRILQKQLDGGTFTITNLGMFDVDFFTPIINLPQSAILGVGRIVDEPVIVGGQVVPGKTLSLSLTFDHRVVDGAPAAGWLQRFAKTIERARDSEAPSA